MPGRRFGPISRAEKRRTVACRTKELQVYWSSVAAWRYVRQHRRRNQNPHQPSLPSLEKQLSLVEKEVVSAAEAMPEEKCSFASSDGEFKGAHTFAQLRHIGSATNMLFGAFYGEKADFELAEKGPPNVTTKAQIVEYLKAAFAKGHRTIATLTPENATPKLENPPFGLVDMRLGAASFACAHAFDHYGQMVV
jgi:DinB superfamily